MAESLDSLRIPDAKKRYIVELLNPVLEEMVAECIHNQPEDPMPFMLEWLEQKKVYDDEKVLSASDKEALLAENKTLEENIERVKSQMNEAAKIAADAKDEEEEEEEEESEDEEMPEDFLKPMSQMGKSRQSVSAEAYGEWNKKKTFVAPVIPKTDTQKERLKECLAKSFLFSGLDDNDMMIVIGAMSEVQATARQRLINQGDDGDFLFVVEEGKLNCIISMPDGSDKVVKTCGRGDAFGELALMYNCPRAASVDAVEKSTLWRLDRDTFTHIGKEAAEKRRARYDNFLTKVPLLQSMSEYERSQLSDAIRPETFDKDAAIVTQGEPGTKFYIIEDGEAVAIKGSEEVMSYHPGDYFGELALIRNQPRAATVKCKTACKVLSIDSGSFKRLLNVNDLLERSTKYS